MNKCLICNKEYLLLGHLSTHVGQIHQMSYKDYYDKFLKSDIDGHCKTCGKTTNFKKGKYSNYCSNSCQNKNIENRLKNSQGVLKAKALVTSEHQEEINKKRLETTIKNYDVENVSQLNETKEKVTTFWDKLSQDDLKKIIDMREVTNLEKYGVKNVLERGIIRDKIHQTNLERYGYITPAKNKEIKDKQSKNKLIKTYNSFIRFNNSVTPLFTIDEYLGKDNPIKYKWKCKKCDTIFEYKYINGIIPLCTKCYPPLHTTELELGNVIKKFYSGNMIINSRSIISGELDYYFPDLNVAVEYNGLYWHSENNNNKDRQYHLNKTILANEKNIKLIHIFEDEWLHKRQIVISRIKNSLGCINRKIYARKCIIKEINSQLSNKFLEKYHIQGKDNAAIHLGAFYKNRLVSVMTFGNLRKALGRKHETNHWELMRFCSIHNFNIIGIGGKLLSYFEKNYKPQLMVSYADRRWSQGNLYYKLGFILDHISKPNYWYMPYGGQKRYHRYGFRKNILQSKLKIYDANLSEWQNMQNNGYDRIWDCGNYVFIKKYN